MDTATAATGRSPWRHGAHVALIAALGLAAAGRADAALVDFRGTIVSVAVDTGGGAFAGLAVGDELTAQFSYGDSPAEASDFLGDAGQADWSFTGAAYFGRVAGDAVSVTGTGNSWLNLQNDQPLSASGATLASTLFGSPIAPDVLVDTWTVGTLSDGSSFDSSGRLVNGAALEFGIMTLSPGAFFDLAYIADPRSLPTLGSAGFFGIVETNAVGDVIFSALGRAELVVPPVPLPASAWLLLSGLGLMLARLRPRHSLPPRN